MTEPQRVHLYPAEKMLAPRGSMEKESLSLDLAFRLGIIWLSWTDEKYSDSLSAEATAYQLISNLLKEIDLAIDDFILNVENLAEDLPEDFAQNCREMIREAYDDTNIDDTPSD